MMINNTKGIAVIMATSMMALMMFIAMEVAYDAQINYASSNNKLNHLKAYYAARAGVKMSLLRVSLYQKAFKTYSSMLKGNTQILDPIWQLPATWPPVLPDDANEIDKSRTQDQVGESIFKAQYLSTVINESGKIDINLLASPNEKVAEATRKQVLSVFTRRVEQDQDFAQRFSDKNFEQLVNNIIDWIDDDENSRNGGSEKNLYPQIDSLPPNQAFKTLKELHMVAEMEDELYNMLTSQVTIFGTLWIDVNAASVDVFRSLSPTITGDQAQAIIDRRNDVEEGGPFKSHEEFVSFVEGLGVHDFNPHGLPLGVEPTRVFRIQSTGQWGQARSDIEAITYDRDNLEAVYTALLDKQDEGEGYKKPDQSQAKKPSSGPPQLVYWREL